jgi:hypothetical protein
VHQETVADSVAEAEVIVVEEGVDSAEEEGEGEVAIAVDEEVDEVRVFERG